MTTESAVTSKRHLIGKHPTCCTEPALEKITWDGEKWVWMTEWQISYCPFCGTQLSLP